MARYLVNSGGVVHSVSDEQFDMHLSLTRQTALQRAKNPFMPEAAGEQIIMPREATPEEIAAYWSRMGLVYDPATGDALTAEEVAARESKATATATTSAAKPAK